MEYRSKKRFGSQTSSRISATGMNLDLYHKDDSAFNKDIELSNIGRNDVNQTLMRHPLK